MMYLYIYMWLPSYTVLVSTPDQEDTLDHLLPLKRLLHAFILKGCRRIGVANAEA